MCASGGRYGNRDYHMRQRVETFGGTIDIRTENGYRIFIHIPKADIPAGR